jgi:hypothetical protein
MTSTPTTEQPLTDAELCEMALAADPDRPLDEDARPLSDLSAPSAEGDLLPAWYMPTARTASSSTWHRTIAAIVILAFLAINALGLCITYGVLEIA